MKKIYIGSLLALAVFAFSCKKDKDKSTADLLQGKWYLTDYKYELRFNGNTIRDSATVNKGEYTLEFKGDQITGQGPSGTYTTSFKVIDGPKLVTSDGDTTEIKTLTDTQLTIHYIDTSVPGNVTDQTDNYKKY
jgi:hypothetical protein